MSAFSRGRGVASGSVRVTRGGHHDRRSRTPRWRPSRSRRVPPPPRPRWAGGRRGAPRLDLRRRNAPSSTSTRLTSSVVSSSWPPRPTPSCAMERIADSAPGSEAGGWGSAQRRSPRSARVASGYLGARRCRHLGTPLPVIRRRTEPGTGLAVRTRRSRSATGCCRGLGGLRLRAYPRWPCGHPGWRSARATPPDPWAGWPAPLLE